MSQSSEKWASRRAAEKALAKLPESVTRHGVAVPFPYRDRQEYQRGLSNRQINEAIRKAPVERVPLEGLHAIQHSVKAPRVQQYIADPHLMKPGTTNPKSKTPIDVPVVVERDGKRWIHDGHHRLTAEKLRGKTVARVRLVSLDKAT